MSKYTVYMVTTASTWVEIEADSPEEAEEALWAGQHSPGLCAQCTSGPGGWGRKSDRGGVELTGDWEVQSVVDEEGNELWDS